MYKMDMLSENSKFDHYKKQINLIKIPYSVSEYNKYMGDIDRINHYLSYYISILWSKKWYKKIIVYMINVALEDVIILYNLYLEKDVLENEGLKSSDFLLSKKRNKNNNILNNSINIIKDPKQHTIIESFKKQKVKHYNDNVNDKI